MIQKVRRFIRDAVPERFEIHLQAIDHFYFGEPEIRDLWRVCDDSRPALDIGANIGTYTYFLRRRSSQVIAYEPHPILAARLSRLFPDVDVREKAVSDSAGFLDLNVPVANGRALHELSSVTQDFSEMDDVERHNVSVVKIDDESIADVGFIKIDVEQNEVPVLSGAYETIARCRPTLLTEVTPLLYENGLIETFNFLCAIDYEGWFTFEGVKISFRDFDLDIHANASLFGKKFMNPNVFFIPSELNPKENIWGLE